MILLIVLWPYVLTLVSLLTLAVCVAIILVAVVIAIFALLQFILIPYYAVKNKECVDIGNYRIADANEPGKEDGRDKKI